MNFEALGDNRRSKPELKTLSAGGWGVAHSVTPTIILSVSSEKVAPKVKLSWAM